MDATALIMQGLISGISRGFAETATDTVKSAYCRLRNLVSRHFAGNPTAEMALTEHATDPDTWHMPLVKAINDSGANAEPSVIEAAQQLMALLDEAGTKQGKYDVDLRGAQGVQVGERNRQINVFRYPS